MPGTSGSGRVTALLGGLSGAPIGATSAGGVGATALPVRLHGDDVDEIVLTPA